MEDLIRRFMEQDYGYGSGYGYGYGSGSGSGDGYGSGYGYGYGSGDGDGSGDGSGFGYGSGSGSGSGDGSGYGSGYGYGYGSGYGSGFGYGSGSGSGSGSGDGIKSVNGEKIFLIDGVQTIISHVHGNVATGFILMSDLSRQPCFIVKEGNKFSHGDTIRSAFQSLQEKMYGDCTEEEWIDKFKDHFSDFDKKYEAMEFFAWHHILTGSCKMGRESFAKDKGLNLGKDTLTVHEFIELTKNAYGGYIITKLMAGHEKVG
jgi:hypothetical protein